MKKEEATKPTLVEAPKRIPVEEARELYVFQLKGQLAASEFARLKDTLQRLQVELKEVEAKYAARFGEICSKHGIATSSRIDFETGEIS